MHDPMRMFAAIAAHSGHTVPKHGRDAAGSDGLPIRSTDWGRTFMQTPPLSPLIVLIGMNFGKIRSGTKNSIPVSGRLGASVFAGDRVGSSTEIPP